MNWSEYIRHKYNHRLSIEKSHALSDKRLQSLKSSKTTKRISYPEHKEAFDYVHNIYPSACVKEAYVYLVSSYDLMEVGYRGVGGFYDSRKKVICITNSTGDSSEEFNVRAEYTIDEVLCHELIHYAVNYKMPMSTREVEEHIAYSQSIGYLRSRGRDDTFIVEKNMLPYLVTTVDSFLAAKNVLTKHFDEKLLASYGEETISELIEFHKKEYFKEKIRLAKEIGHRIISQYDGVFQEKEHRPKQLILDDIFDDM